MMSRSQNSQSQSVENIRFTELLKPIKELADKPMNGHSFEVSLSRILEECIDLLRDVNITFDGGTSLNFAEAAMLIQSSTNLYGKRVDFLHTILMKTMDTLSQRGKDASVEDGEDASGGDKGSRRQKRKNMADLGFSFLSVEIAKNIDLKRVENTLEELKALLKLIQPTPRQLIDKDGIDNSIAKVDLFYGKNLELLASKQDFRLNSQYNSETGMIGENLHINNEATDFHDGDLSIDMDSDSSLCIGWNVGLDAERYQFNEDVEAQAPLGQSAADPEALAPYPDAPDDEYDDLGPPVDCPPEDIDDHPGDLDNETDVSEKAVGQRRSSRRRDMLADRQLDPPPVEEVFDPWKPLDPFALQGTPKKMQARQLLRIPPDLMEKWKAAKASNKKKDKQAEQDKRKCTKNISEFIAQNIMQSAPSIVKSDKVGCIMTDFILAERDRIKSVMKLVAEKSKGKRLQQKDDEPPHYNQLEEETNQDELDDHYENVVDPDIPDDDLVADIPHGMDEEALPEVNDGASFSASMPELSSTQGEESESQPVRSYEDLVARRVAEFIKKSQAYVLTTELAKRVSDWHGMIAPRLELVEKRSAFDIHAYGSDILNVLGNAQSRSLEFSQIVRGKTREEMARYFLSSLMLANCMNVEIGYEGDYELGINNFHLNYLSNKRHHEELEEFQAASQRQTDHEVTVSPQAQTSKRKKKDK